MGNSSMVLGTNLFKYSDTLTMKTQRGTRKIPYIEVIGQGAYGIVYKGTDEKGNTIAAKRIDFRPINQHATRLKNLLDLDHPNIVKYFDIHNENDILWTIMEICPSGDLNTFYCKKRIPLIASNCNWN